MADIKKPKQSNQHSLNILVYSSDEISKSNFTKFLKSYLNCDRYTIYPISKETLVSGVWKGKTALLALIGNVENTRTIIDYFAEGGRILAFNNNISNILILQNHEGKGTNEVLKSMKLNDFKIERLILNEQMGIENESRFETLDLKFKDLSLVDTGKEAFIKVTNTINDVVALFTKANFEDIEQATIKIILKDVLRLHTSHDAKIDFTPGYFLGNFEKKLKLIKDWCSSEQLIMKIGDITIQWCLKGDTPIEKPSKSFLPIYCQESPKNFAYEEYFLNLKTKYLGQLLIYSNVLTSTMDIAKESLVHGIAVVTIRQITGQGRGGNLWITPSGQAAITLQIWQKISPTLSLIQHAAALATVLAIRQNDYTDLDIRIKWPNDIYHGRDIKIGGVITTANCIGDDVVVNIGTGVNIANEVPTVCVNRIIEDYNRLTNKNLPVITIEKFLANYCTELEKILDGLGLENGVEKFQEQYYKYWLHSNEVVHVKMEQELVQGTIMGVDSAGWLLVKIAQGDITVTPDGNSFDMMKGLIGPK